jgi:cobalt/nickel transport system permease protein
MHIPDGFLTDPVCTVCTLASAGSLGYGFTRVRGEDGPRWAPLMAAPGAGIFAAQMVNFPIGSGTSAHVIGAALAAIVLGPWRGMLTMAIVLAVQCFVFGDGGVRALGANLLNMAVVAPLVASALYVVMARRVGGTRGKLAGAGTAAFGAVLASAAMCSLELAASGTYGFSQVFAAMMGAHLVIALAEAAITMTVVAAAVALLAEGRVLSTRGVMIGGLAAAVVVAGLLAPVASLRPDGLERVALDLNFAPLATSSWAVAPDYAVPGVGWSALAVAIAGIGGALIVFVTTYTIGRTAKVRVRKH